MSKDEEYLGRGVIRGVERLIVGVVADIVNHLLDLSLHLIVTKHLGAEDEREVTDHAKDEPVVRIFSSSRETT